ncbi:heavy metal transporter [Streptomyces griseoaurantiacus]|uniref:heavy metal transporter n=1 Tax=Streptomyces griseoaurantiacus TaxID=68213 RepID=UPI003628A899
MSAPSLSPAPSPAPARSPAPAFLGRGRLARWGAALAALLALTGYLTLQYLIGGGGAPRCRVVADHGGTSYEFTPEQAENAATISAVGTSRGLPERAVTIALATALQESGLHNIGHGDRDSLGLFQQRPSQGWGTRRQIMDPAYAAGAFYDHLVRVPGYARLPLTVAAQRVQRSGFPRAYAKHEPDARLLATALTGHSAATLTCEGRPAPTPAGGPDAVRAALVRDFGRQVLPAAGTGTEAGSGVGVRASVTTAPSAGDRGDAGGGDGGGTRASVTVPVPRGAPAEGRTRRTGWELAHWAVAHSSALHIARVSYAGLEWSRGGGAGEWRTVERPRPGAGAGEDGKNRGAGREAAGTDVVRIATGD